MKQKDLWIIILVIFVLSVPAVMIWSNVQVCKNYFKEMNTFACLISTKTTITPQANR